MIPFSPAVVCAAAEEFSLSSKTFTPAHTTATTTTTTVINPNPDTTLVGSPPDAVTQLAWSPDARWLAASSWAKQLRIWEMKADMMSVPRFTFRVAVPMLTTVWPSEDVVAYGTLDGGVSAVSMTSCQTSMYYKHASAVSCSAVLPNTLITGSWDHTVKLFDVRSNKIVKETFLSNDVFCMDAKQHLLVVGTADREVSTWDVRKLDRAVYGLTIEQNSLQLRSVALMNDLSGYVEGTLNGRCSVVYYSDIGGQPANYYAFRCHSKRIDHETVELHAVNAVAYHPTEPSTLATCGSDGRFCVWDTHRKTHIRSLPSLLNVPLTAFQWSPLGTSAVYAAGNDFSHGTTSAFSKIYWHAWESQDDKKQ